MHRRFGYVLCIAAIVLALPACGAAPAGGTVATVPALTVTVATSEPTAPASVEPTIVVTAEPTVAAMPEPTAPASVEPTIVVTAEPTVAATVDRPLWQTIALTDARTGQAFVLADFAGRTVYVEPMATWCSNCRKQLENVAQARSQLGDDVVFVALSVETNIAAADLAQYADQAGFGWTFAVATPELLRELTAVFGRTITNPPSTPHFVIRPDGTTSELATGIKSVEQIVASLQNGN